MIDTITTETGNIMQSQESQDQWITTADAAEIMDVGEAQVRKLCRQYHDSNGDIGIKSKKPGRDWLVWLEAAEEYERKRKPSE